MTPIVFRVALDTPLKRLFDYLPPERPLRGAPIEPGMRVRVPFGRQRLVGIVDGDGRSSDVPTERLKSILEVLDPRPILDAAALALLRLGGGVLPPSDRRGALDGAAEGAAAGCGGRGTRRAVERDAGRARGADARGAPAGAEAAGSCWRSLVWRAMATAGVFGGGARRDAGLKWRDAARALAARGWVLSVEVAPADGRRRGLPSELPGPSFATEQRAAVEAVGAALGHFGALRPSRRHRQRQDRGLPAARRASPRPGPPRPRAGARDRPDAAARRSVSRAVRRRRWPCCTPR